MRNFYKKLALVCTTFAMVTFIATSQTTLNIKVANNDDDVEEYREDYTTTAGVDPNGYMDLGSSDLELCTQNANNRQAVGIIFKGVTIPKGATINSAFIQFTADDITSNGTGPLGIDIVGFKEANTAAPFTSALFGVTSRPVTTAKVTWNAVSWDVKDVRGPDQMTSDIKTIVTEIIGQAGWASGNNMGFKLTNEVMEKIHREADAADSGVDFAPELIVTYTAGVAVEKIDASNGLIYPNPSDGKFMVKNPSAGNFGYGIYTMNGSMVRSRDNISGSTTEVDMSKSAKGQYFVIVKSANQTAKSKLILK